MEPPTVGKTFKYQLNPTPEQEWALDTVLLRCRKLYNCALEQRTTWWERGQGKSATSYQQAMELPDLKAACPEYAEVHSQVLQDVLRRVANGDMPGYPRFQGHSRYHSFTYPQYGNGAVLGGGILSMSKIGRILVCLHRPLQGIPKTVTISKEADGWYVSFSCAEVPLAPLPLTGRETGINVGLKVFLVTAEGGASRQSTPLPQSGARAEEGAQAGQPPPEGERTASESRPAMRQEASARAPATDGLSP
jgi:putative transposase